MRKLFKTGLLLATAGLAAAACAQTGSVKMVSPTEGAMLESHRPVEVAFEVVQGTMVDHIHLYVDGRQSAIIREAMGTHMVRALPTGSHELCVKAVTKAHVLTGMEDCRKVMVK